MRIPPHGGTEPAARSAGGARAGVGAPSSRAGTARVGDADVPGAGARGAVARKRSRIHLLVLFTPAAAAGAFGGTPGLKDAIAAAVADGNAALAASAVQARFRLQKIKRVNYDAGGDLERHASRALDELTAAGDGRLDVAHRLRARFGSDIVTLIVQRNLDLCGLAWLAGARSGVTPADAEWAFNVVPHNCLRLDALPHEIGHNMGAQHARGDPVSPTRGAYDDSFGYKLEGKARTLMAYGCADPCAPALLFSTPAVAVDGSPVGAAGLADNARSFNADRETIAAFRTCRRKCR